MPAWANPHPEMVGHGVHIAPWLDITGNPIVVAVGADNLVVSYQPWLPCKSYDEIADELWYMLDRVRPSLEITP